MRKILSVITAISILPLMQFSVIAESETSITNEVSSSLVTEEISTYKAYGFEKECYYAIVNTCRLFDIYESNIDDLLKKIAPDDLSYLNRVIFPAEKRVYTYNVDVKEWCFLNNRKDYLSEARI